MRTLARCQAIKRIYCVRVYTCTFKNYNEVKIIDLIVLQVGVTHFPDPNYEAGSRNPTSDIQQPAIEPTCANIGRWINEKYIVLNKLHDCRHFVEKFLEGAPTKTWAFFGDSTMRYLVSHIFENTDCTYHMVKKCKTLKCTYQDYFELGFNIKKQPMSCDEQLRCKFTSKFSGEFRAGCASSLHICKDKSIEWIMNAFANDENYTYTANTKLELFAGYFSKHPKDVCLVNTGLHDLAKRTNTVTKFTDNVRNYLTQLQPYCNKLIWISINRSLNKRVYAQRNDKIMASNRSVQKMLQKYFPSVGYIAVDPMSKRRDMHIDNLHMNATYYNTEARFFTKFL